MGRRESGLQSGFEIAAEYRASLSQSDFLRTLLRDIPTAVVAGSFPVAHYLFQQHLKTFKPHDIDVFVTDPAHVDAVTLLYTPRDGAIAAIDVVDSK